MSCLAVSRGATGVTVYDLRKRIDVTVTRLWRHWWRDYIPTDGSASQWRHQSRHGYATNRARHSHRSPAVTPVTPHTHAHTERETNR